MGFMKFGKKDKNALDELDIPPPPPIENMAPPVDNKPNYPKIPQMQPAKEPPMPQFKEDLFPPQPAQNRMGEMPPSFDIPEFKMDNKNFPEDFSGFDKKRAEENPPSNFEQLFKPMPQQKRERSPVKEISEPRSSGQVFIEVNNYRQILKDFSVIKKSLKQSDEQISTLVGDMEDEEKIFAQLHETLADVEQKLHQLEQGIFGQ